jgi:hypothetical protein
MPIPWELAYQINGACLHFSARYDGNPALSSAQRALQINVMYFAAGQDETNVTNLALSRLPTLSACTCRRDDHRRLCCCLSTTAIVLNPVNPSLPVARGQHIRRVHHIPVIRGYVSTSSDAPSPPPSSAAIRIQKDSDALCGE